MAKRHSFDEIPGVIRSFAALRMTNAQRNRLTKQLQCLRREKKLYPALGQGFFDARQVNRDAVGVHAQLLGQHFSHFEAAQGLVHYAAPDGAGGLGYFGPQAESLVVGFLDGIVPGGVAVHQVETGSQQARFHVLRAWAPARSASAARLLWLRGFCPVSSLPNRRAAATTRPAQRRGAAARPAFRGLWDSRTVRPSPSAQGPP